MAHLSGEKNLFPPSRKLDPGRASDDHGVGAYFRLVDLDGMPPQMTSDHKKSFWMPGCLGWRLSVFFPNNGGREGFQMYALALIAHIPGLGVDHFSLKMLAAIESLITLPVLWWMGREVIGDRDRRLGNSVGLVLMALVAASYWHVAITRVALRIVLTRCLLRCYLPFWHVRCGIIVAVISFLPGCVGGWSVYLPGGTDAPLVVVVVLA